MYLFSVILFSSELTAFISFFVFYSIHPRYYIRFFFSFPCKYIYIYLCSVIYLCLKFLITNALTCWLVAKKIYLISSAFQWDISVMFYLIKRNINLLKTDVILSGSDTLKTAVFTFCLSQIAKQFDMFLYWWYHDLD